MRLAFTRTFAKFNWNRFTSDKINDVKKKKMLCYYEQSGFKRKS